MRKFRWFFFGAGKSPRSPHHRRERGKENLTADARGSGNGKRFLRRRSGEEPKSEHRRGRLYRCKQKSGLLGAAVQELEKKTSQASACATKTRAKIGTQAEYLCHRIFYSAAEGGCGPRVEKERHRQECLCHKRSGPRSRLSRARLAVPRIR